MTIHSCCWPADPRCCRGPTRCVSGSRQAAGGGPLRPARLRSVDDRRPGGAGYYLRDLAADAAALVGTLGAMTAHLGGVGVGGMVAQVAALDHSNAFSALTLVSTRPVAPGPVDDDLPDHDAATMDAVFSRPMPDWTDRSAVAAFAADGAELLGNDPEQARATAARIWDRTPSSEPSVQQANQLGMVFARLDCAPRWRQRLGELTLPTLVVHGRADPFFPVGNGEALADAIPAARLLVLDDMGTALRDAAADESRRNARPLTPPPDRPAAAGFGILLTAVQAPRMNAICERLVGTLRRESSSIAC